MNAGNEPSWGCDDSEPLPPMQALRSWSDPQALRHLDEVRQFERRPVFSSVCLATQALDAYSQGHSEWRRRLAPLHNAFIARLKSGSIVATGFAQPLTPSSRRERIDVALFELLELDYLRAEAKYGDLSFTHVEVSRPYQSESSGPVEAAAADASRLTAVSSRTFSNNGRYTRVSIDGQKFVLSGGLCTVVRLLHEASLTEDPWRNTKDILAEAKYASESLAAVFRRHDDPSWKELIEHDKGYCRLRL